MSNEPISAAILAGGKSSRMGRDKAMIEVGGRPAVQYVIDALLQLTDDIKLVGERPGYSRLGIPVVPDDQPGLGPIGGIATALRHALFEHVIIVACDMPLVSPRLLKAMASEPRTYDAMVPQLTGKDGVVRYEPMHAIYGKRCLEAIDAQVGRGEVRVYHLFQQINVRVPDEGWLRQHDPDLASFTNMNTPMELERVRRRIEACAAQGKDDRLARDYSKFLHADGTLNTRLIPRPVYTQMVNAYRQQEHVVREVFEQHFWLWDYQEAQRKAQAEGRETDPADLAQEVLNGMDDKEWWEVMTSFERHFNEAFPENPDRWAEFLDPVYDDQEVAGWTRRQ